MDIKSKVLNAVVENSLQYFTPNDLANALAITDDFSFKQLQLVIEELVEDGRLIKTSKKKYVTAEKLGYVRGEISSSDRGFAFLLPENKEIKDIFIPPTRLNGALHKDIVLVAPLSSTRSRGSAEGEVFKIIKRGIFEVVGTYCQNKRFGFVIPDNKNVSVDIFINDKSKGKAKNGDKVVAKITGYPADRKNPDGCIIEIIGDKNTPRIEFLSILKAHGYELDFPQKVHNQAESMPTVVGEQDILGREDFRNTLTVTIDGDDARDFDDAISLEKTTRGTYILGVHIADVSHYVRPNSLIEAEAYKRATSVYFPSLVLPMLPKKLSNGICSLNEGVDRLTLSVIAEIDSNGSVLNHRIANTVINSDGRLTYDKVNMLFDGDKQIETEYAKVKDMLLIMKELSEILIDRREKRGSIDFDIVESKIIVDANDKILGIEPADRALPNKLIEEFMILANRIVAEFVFYLELPFVYRVHETPTTERLKAFVAFLSGFGVKFKHNLDNVFPKEFADLLTSLRGRDYYNVVNKVMLRSMQKAKYDKVDVGHFGLALEHYCHFTSPIRRYADLTVHRILKKIIANEFNPTVNDYYKTIIDDICNQCSVKSRNSEEAEREVDDFYKAKYMLDKIGECYSGIISGVTNFGVFVELENTVEGLIKLENLPPDKYSYNEGTYVLQGINNKFRLGDKLDIRVKDVTMATHRVEFEINRDGGK